MILGAASQECPAYTCTTCGRDRIALAGDAPTDDRCARCRMLPGWHRRPEVVALCEADAQLLAASPEDHA